VVSVFQMAQEGRDKQVDFTEPRFLGLLDKGAHAFNKDSLGLCLKIISDMEEATNIQELADLTLKLDP
jgi:hypothetical protein